MNRCRTAAAACTMLFCAWGMRNASAAGNETFARPWVHAGRTSAVIYWHVGDISKEAADSYVEYGETRKYGKKTEMVVPATTTKIRKPNSRWAHLHWIKGLEPGKTYHYRMAMSYEGREVKSPDRTFKTNEYEKAVEIKGKAGGGTVTLDKANTTYILTEDIKANKGGIVVGAPGVTLELDGHTVRFSEANTKQTFGIRIDAPNAKVFNGRIVEGRGGNAKAYNHSAACGSFWKANGLEVAGIFTDVHLPSSYPLKLFGSAKGKIDIHHNHFYSRVTMLQSRHYPGNDLTLIDISKSGGNTEAAIHHNLYTEGCHRGITVRGGEPKSLDIYENDMRHHQQFVNGHAFAGCRFAKVHHNHVTSTGRGMQIGRDMEIYDNWFDIQGHMTLSDLPKGSRPFKKRRVELHGFKFEGKGCVNVKLHDNFIRITQHLPNKTWDYVPATPLNAACYNPNAMNEVYNNTFVALTEYKKTHHGGYGQSGQWASAIYFVEMKKGPAEKGKYSIYIHDNTFISNDLFLSSSRAVNMTVRIEKNRFKLAAAPPPTAGHQPFRSIGNKLIEVIKAGGNTFGRYHRHRQGNESEPDYAGRPVTPKPRVKAAGKMPVGGSAAPTRHAEAPAAAELTKKLRAVIIERAARKKPFVYVKFLGRVVRARLLGASEDGVKARWEEADVPLPWKELDPKRLYGMAAKLTSNHKLLADYCEAVGLAELATSERMKIK